MPNISPVVMENVRIIFRNFAGAEGMYSRAGDRNFSVVLPPDLAEQMKKDGWNVKYLKARDEDEEETPYLGVAVNFKGRPPTVKMITSKGATALDEDSVEILDWVDIDNVDMIVTPYEWTVNGKSGVKAYLQSLYITIIEDPLAMKYDNMEISTINGPAMIDTDDPLKVHSVRGEMKELER